MARIKLGMLASSIVGSIGGQTVKRVPNGWALMNKNKGGSLSKQLSNPRLGSLASIFKRWGSLTSSERTSWSVASLLFLFPDKFGDPVNLSPRGLFTKLNCQLLPTGTSVNDATGINSSIEEFIFERATYTVPASLFLIDVSVLSGTCKLLLQIQYSKTYIFSPTFTSRKINAIIDVTGSASIDIWGQISSQFPNISPTDSIFVYATAINEWGFKSPTQFVRAELVE